MGFLSSFFGGSKSKSSSTTKPAEFTPEQDALRSIAQRVGETQLENLLRSSQFQVNLEGDVIDIPQSDFERLGADATTSSAAAQDELLQRELERIRGGDQPSQLIGGLEGSALGSIDMQDRLLMQELERIRGGTGATPEQQQLIKRITDERIAAGESDIQASLQDRLTTLRREIAPSLGLRPGDTPIQDRGQLLAREALRLSAQLSSQARSSEAQALLDFPLRSGELTSARTAQLLQALQGKQSTGIAARDSALRTEELGSQRTLAQQNVSLALREFQEKLRAQDFQRRLATGSLGLSLAGIEPSQIGFIPPGSETTTASRSSGPGLGFTLLNTATEGVFNN